MNNTILKCDNCKATIETTDLIPMKDGPETFYECPSCYSVGMNPNPHRWDCCFGRRHGGYAWKHRWGYQRCIVISCLPVCITSTNNGCGCYHSAGRIKRFFQILFRMKIPIDEPIKNIVKVNDIP